MKRILMLIVSIFVALSVISGCNTKEASKESKDVQKEVQDENVNSENEIKEDEEKGNKNEKDNEKDEKDSDSSEDKDVYIVPEEELANIDIDSKPYGVFDVSFLNDYLQCCIINNSDEDAYIEVTFRVYNNEDKYIGEIILGGKVLEPGEIYSDFDYVGSEGRAEIRKITGTPGDVMKKNEEIESYANSISEQIDAGNYNLAEAYFDEFKELYPEEKTVIKRIGAAIKDYKSKAEKEDNNSETADDNDIADEDADEDIE